MLSNSHGTWLWYTSNTIIIYLCEQIIQNVMLTLKKNAENYFLCYFLDVHINSCYIHTHTLSHIFFISRCIEATRNPLWLQNEWGGSAVLHTRTSACSLLLDNCWCESPRKWSRWRMPVARCSLKVGLLQCVILLSDASSVGDNHYKH